MIDALILAVVAVGSFALGMVVMAVLVTSEP